MILEYCSRSPEATLALGDALGVASQPGLVILLQGPLGAGKTQFTKGVARGLGIGSWRYVTSPTFALHNQYQGRLPLHHLDLYRLADSKALEGIGLEEFLYGSGVCVIEWPDSFSDDLPADRILARFCFGDGDTRQIVISSSGPLSDGVCAELAVHLPGDSGKEEVPWRMTSS